MTFQLEDQTFLNFNGQQVSIRNMTIEDECGQAKAALWRVKSDINMNVGDHIQVIYGRTTLYNGVVVNTTQKSTVTVSIQFTPNQKTQTDDV